VVESLRALIADLRAFTARQTAIELLVAFALGWAIVGLANAVVSGLVITPITVSGPTFGGVGALSFVLDGQIFQTEGILGSVIVVVLIAAAAAVFVRKQADVLWQDEGELVECPFCLSEIPARAQVCAQCTRDLPAAP
jgi:large-conductance mechanosensitive channel